MGRGIMLDHNGIVIGETTVIDDNVSILQQVTLGGTGNEQGDRHPKIKSGVLIAAGATVLGNITVGEGAKMALAASCSQMSPRTRLWSEYPPRNQASRILRHRPKPCSKTSWQIPTRVDRLTGQTGQQTRACPIHVHELIESAKSSHQVLFSKSGQNRARYALQQNVPTVLKPLNLSVR